jgi:uncharacterized membrane protein YqaE (UPF0057 family)
VRYGHTAYCFSNLAAACGCFFDRRPGDAFWINILLTLLGFIPGMVHALWVIVKKKEN